MEPSVELDPDLMAELESKIDDCDFLYAEQQDTPCYDYLLVCINENTLEVCERMEFKKQNQKFELSRDLVRKLATISIPDLSVPGSNSSLFGGAWVCIYVRGQGPLRCNKIESKKAGDRVVFDSWLNLFTGVLQDLGVHTKGEWYASPDHTPGSSTRSGDPLIIDMNLPLRIRAVAERMGLKYASDFAHVDVSEFKREAGLNGINDQTAMLEELNRELNKFGISIN